MGKISAALAPLALFAIFVLIFVSCGGEPVDLSGGNASDGQVIYDAECASCHASDGTGNAGGSGAPDIVDISAANLQDAVRNGPGSMNSFDTDVISEQDLKDLYAYIQTF